MTSLPARVAGAAALIALAVWLFIAKALPRTPDFEVYWRAGARAAAAEPLYRAADADYQFKYFPAFAVIATPLGAMPLDAAKAVWFALSAAALVALLSMTVAALPHRRKPAWLLITVLFIALGKYYAEDLVLGQINILVACVAAAALLAFRAGREPLGGVLVALAVVLKPYALILAPWVAARRRPAAMTSLSAGLALALLIPAVIYGLEGTLTLHREWWRTVTTTTQDTLLHSDNVSLASLWAKWLGIGSSAATLALASSIAVLLTGAFVTMRRTSVKAPDTLEAGLLLAITPLVSPQGWDYTLILATMAVAIVVNDIDRLPRTLRVLTIAGIAVIGLSLYDLLGRRVLYALLEWSAITMATVALIGVLATLRLKKLA